MLASIRSICLVYSTPAFAFAFAALDPAPAPATAPRYQSSATGCSSLQNVLDYEICTLYTLYYTYIYDIS